MRVTIIIPVFNSEKYVHIPLDSLATQTREDFDVVIVDDGSTDDSYKVIKPYLDQHPNWKYFKKKNGHWGSVINYVIKNNLIEGDYVTILDSDDFFLDVAVEAALHEFERDESIDMVIGKIFYQKNGTLINLPVIYGHKKYVKKIRARIPISTPHGKFYKKELFMSLTPLREGVPYQDAILYNEMVTKSSSIYYISQPLAVWWSDRPGNSTTEVWDQKRIDLWIDNIETIAAMDTDKEVTSYALMYLWELGRRTQFISTRKAVLDTKGIKFSWLPLGIGRIVKYYFLWRTRKMRVKPSQVDT